MPLLQPDYFTGEIAIGQIEQSYVADNVQLFIDQYESEFCIDLLGTDLYTDLLAGLEETTPLQKWIDLKNQLLPMVSRYVYFYYMQNQITHPMGIGTVTVNSELSSVVNPAQKQVTAWNKMVLLRNDFVKNIDKNTYDIKPNYYYNNKVNKYSAINPYGGI